jgi:predicted DNA binding protein
VVLTGVSSNHRQDFLALSARARARRPAAERPERQVQTRLTDAEVVQLITAYQAGAKINQLAIDFGINRNTASSILRAQRHQGL